MLPAFSNTIRSRGKATRPSCARLLMKNATCLLACSKQAGIYLYGEKAVRCGRVELFANAVDVDAFAFRPQTAAELRAQFGAGEETPCHRPGGPNDPRKKPRIPAGAGPPIEREGDGLRFLLIGDGPLRASLAQKVALYGLGDRVIFTGLREDVDVLLQALDGFAHALSDGRAPGGAGGSASGPGFPAWFPTAFPKKPIWAFPWCSFCRRTTFIKRTGSKLYPTAKDDPGLLWSRSAPLLHAGALK